MTNVPCPCGKDHSEKKPDFSEDRGTRIKQMVDAYYANHAAEDDWGVPRLYADSAASMVKLIVQSELERAS